MFADELKKKHQRIIYSFVKIESVLAVFFIVLFFAYEQYAKASILILLGMIAFSMIMFVFLTNRRIRKAYECSFKVSSLEYTIPFPSSFKKHLRTLLIDGKRGYNINRKIIPAKFVEFVEGKRAYLIKQLTEIHETNCYKILYIHELTYALVEDVDQKKWLVHMNCLEQI